MRRVAQAQGFSIVEVLVALLLLLMIILGLIPLFVQSSQANVSGKRFTQVSNFARSRVEEFFQRPFNSPELTIDAGSDKVFSEYFSRADEAWKPGAPPEDGSDPATWIRTTTIRQYQATALDDGTLDEADALPADTDPTQIQLKEIEVELRAVRAEGEAIALGVGKNITLRALKSQ